MKRLILTDTHLGINNDSDIWLNVVYKLFQDVNEYCDENDIKEIIHLGDFFHNRKSLNTKTQDYAHHIASLLKGKKTYLVVGNHDCYYKNTIHPTSLSLFKEYEQFIVVDEPITVDDILLLPWGTEIPDADIFKCKYCFGHFAINGFHMNDSYVCRDGIDKKRFNDFDLILSGHFHTPSKQKNIVYLGSPYAQTFHDANGTRGFYTFEDGKLNFIEYGNAPKFYKIKTDNIDHSLIEGNIIKLVFVEDYGTNKNQRKVDEVTKHNPLAFSIDFTNVASDEVENEEDEAVMENRTELVKSYISKKEFPENINKKTLENMFIKMMKDVEK